MSPPETLGAIFAGRYEPAVIESCLDALDADPVFYTSAEIIDDLDAVRSFLGYEQFNLVGVSYGSRLALGYLERFPDRVRTAALRGVASRAGNLLSDIGLASEQAIARLFARCSADPECSSEFPDLEPAARRILARFEDQPLALRTARPGGESVHVTVPVPTLLMSGSDDPATSAEAADEIGRLLEDSRHLVTPGLAHFPVWTDCFADNVAKLVRSGSTGAITAGCVENYVAVSPG